MIKRLFTSKSKTITGAAIILGAASLVSRLIGVLRDRIFAHQFGAGDILDAYYAAFRVPDLVYNLVIVGALSAGFIPVFTKLYIKNKRKAWEVTNSVINILSLILFVTCATLFIFTPQLIQLIVPGFNGDKLQLTMTLTRIMFLSPILLGLSSIVSGVLQSMKCFLIYALTPIMYNLGIIVGAVLIVPKVGPVGLAYGVIFGALLHLVIQLPALFQHGFRYKPLFSWKNKHVREIGKLMIPRTLGIGATQLNLLVITAIASGLAAGSLTIFNFANNLQYFPIGIIGYSFAIAAFPTLSEFIAKNQTKKMTRYLSDVIRQVLFFIIPITVVFLLLRAQIVRVVLGSGQFDRAATILTGHVLAFFSFSLFAQAIIPVLVRGYFALHDTWSPFIISVISVLINIILALTIPSMFSPEQAVVGLAMAFSIAAILQLAMLWIHLRQKIGSLGELSMLQLLYKISIAALVMAVTIQSLKAPIANMVDMNRFWGIFTQGAIAGTTGLIIYALLCYLLQVDEMMQFLASFRRKFLKTKYIQAEINEADEI